MEQVHGMVVYRKLYYANLETNLVKAKLGRSTGNDTTQNKSGPQYKIKSHIDA